MKRSNADDEKRDMREGEMMKKGKTEAGIINVGGLGTPLNRLPENFVNEIFKRLPAKALHRFMCVSKAWRSIIRNPLFLRAYLRQQRHGCLLIAITDERTYKRDLLFPEDPLGLSVYYSPLIQAEDRVRNPEPFLNLIQLPAFDSCKGVTKVVNGLVCAYGSNGAMVCNICTRETVWLPEICGFPNSTYEDYYLGYHPDNGLYKLLKISKSNFEQEAHVLTLGCDSSWRKLAIGLDGSDRFPAKSFLCNGVLYWALYGLVERLGLNSFDLKTEKFQFIGPPNEPIFSHRDYRWTLAQFRGQLALLLHRFSKLVPDEGFVIRTLDNFDDQGGSSWSKHVLPCPPGIQGAARLSMAPIGNLPTGQILLTDGRYWKDSNSFIPVYSYNDQEDKFERFIVGSVPREAIRTLRLTFKISYFAEQNTVSLAVLFGQNM